MSDPILLWNEIALEANRVSHSNGQGEQTGPPLSARALAIVHLAMYDAFAGCVNNPANLPLYYEAELQPSLPPANTPPDEAVAVAASLTLSWLFPSQEPTFRRLRDAVTTDRGSAAYVYGQAVFDAVKTDREGDPGVGSASYTLSMARGHHRPDPDNLPQQIHAPDYGRLSKGFGITTRFELAPPPFGDGADPEYVRALREVRGKGIKPELFGTLPDGITPRNPNETLIGLYWAYDGVLQVGTPPRLYNQVVREVAREQGNSPERNARLFAFVNVAMADAGILAWDQKYIHDFWRPVIGIREHDKSIGPEAADGTDHILDDCDPLWLPLGAPNTNRIGKNFTPPFPAYPSGHATFGAAALHVVRLFYGQGGTFKDRTLTPDSLMQGLHFVSEELNGANTDNMGTARPRHVRTFDEGLWQMIRENSRSRVYLGVHWVFDGFAVRRNGEPNLYRTDAEGRPIGGVPLGLQIAEDIFEHGGGKGPRKSTVGPRPGPVDPAGSRTATYASSYPR